jgi:hypothetical protein
MVLDRDSQRKHVSAFSFPATGRKASYAGHIHVSRYLCLILHLLTLPELPRLCSRKGRRLQTLFRKPCDDQSVDGWHCALACQACFPNFATDRD